MKRLNIGFISFLMLLSLVCIGFSSWNIVYDRSDYVNGNIDVDEIIDGTKYISCTEFTLFDFFKTGFVNSDGIISYTANINSKFNINLEECREEFTNSTSLEVIIDLSRSNLSKFNSTDSLSMTHTITYNSTSISGVDAVTNQNDYILTFELPLLTELNTIELQIVYTLEINDSSAALSYFKEKIYPELMSSNKFGINAKITGK